MPSIVGVDFINKGVSPIERMGSLPDAEHPGIIGERFEKGFTFPPVGDDYYAEMYAVAIYNGGHRQKVSGDVQTVLKVSHAPEFLVTASYFALTGNDQMDINLNNFGFKLDMSHVTEFEIEPECITTIQLRKRMRIDAETWGEWEELEPVSSEAYLTFADNIFTWVATGDVTFAVGSHEIQWRVFDSTIRLINDGFVTQPVASKWSESRQVVIIKQING